MIIKLCLQFLMNYCALQEIPLRKYLILKKMYYGRKNEIFITWLIILDITYLLKTY